MTLATLLLLVVSNAVPVAPTPHLMLNAGARDRLAELGRRQATARATMKAVAAIKPAGDPHARVLTLVRAYAVKPDRRQAEALAKELVRWSRGFAHEGDPAQNPALKDAATAHATVRPALTGARRKLIDGWLRKIGQRAMTAGESTVDPAQPKTALDAERVRLVGTIGFALQDQPMLDWTLSAFGLVVSRGLPGADGPPVALLEPLVALAVDAAGLGVGVAGTDLYRFEADGASLRKSATALKRAKAEDDPRAAHVLTLASFFEPKLAETAERWRGESLDGAWLALTIEALRAPPPERKKRRRR
jgi:hypothetical protein